MAGRSIDVYAYKEHTASIPQSLSTRAWTSSVQAIEHSCETYFSKDHQYSEEGVLTTRKNSEGSPSSLSSFCIAKVMNPST